MHNFLILTLLLQVTITAGAQSLRVTEEILIPDSIVPGPYFQVSPADEIFILADNGIFHLNKKKWVIPPMTNMAVVSFSLHPTTGGIDYLTIYDIKTGIYGLYQHIVLDNLSQLRLVRIFESHYKLAHPIQLENEVFIFWELEDTGFGFGKIIHEDTIATFIELKEGKAGPFTMVSRNSLFFYLDNIVLNYEKEIGLKGSIFTPGIAQSICYDGYSGLHLSTEIGIHHLSSDGTVIPVYYGEAGIIKRSNDKIFNYIQSSRKIKVLMFSSLKAERE